MKLFRAVIALPALALGIAAYPQLTPIEQAIEVEAGSVILPSGESGTIVVTQCHGCTPVSLLVTPRSRYFLGDVQISLADMRRELADRPDALLVMLYDERSGELRRLLASARPGSVRQTSRDR